MRFVCFAFILAAVAACGPGSKKPKIEPASSCGATCSSNIECNQGLIPTCKFCNFGTCRAVRPELVELDAGVEADPDAW